MLPVKRWQGLPKRDWATTATSSLLRLPSVFFLLGCAIYLGYYVSAQLHPVAIETCQLAPYRRDLNPDNVALQEGGPWLPKAVREVLFFWIIRIVIATLWVSLLFYSPNKMGMLMSMLIVTGGYFVGLAIVEELKLRSDDFECHSNHANGFSGHAFYGVWALCTIYYYYLHLLCALADRAQPDMRWTKGQISSSEQFKFSATGSPFSAAVDTLEEAESDHDSLEQLRLELIRREEMSKPPISKRAELGLCVVASFCILAQLLYTYRYGYHSPRQMLLASSIGALYCGLSFLLSQVVILTFREVTGSHSRKNKPE